MHICANNYTAHCDSPVPPKRRRHRFQFDCQRPTRRRSFSSVRWPWLWLLPSRYMYHVRSVTMATTVHTATLRFIVTTTTALRLSAGGIARGDRAGFAECDPQECSAGSSSIPSIIQRPGVYTKSAKGLRPAELGRTEERCNRRSSVADVYETMTLWRCCHSARRPRRPPNRDGLHALNAVNGADIVFRGPRLEEKSRPALGPIKKPAPHLLSLSFLLSLRLQSSILTPLIFTQTSVPPLPRTPR